MFTKPTFTSCYVAEREDSRPRFHRYIQFSVKCQERGSWAPQLRSKYNPTQMDNCHVDRALQSFRGKRDSTVWTSNDGDGQPSVRLRGRRTHQIHLGSKTATSAATSLASCVQVPPDNAWPLVSRFHPGRWLFPGNFSNFSNISSRGRSSIPALLKAIASHSASNGLELLEPHRGEARYYGANYHSEMPNSS